MRKLQRIAGGTITAGVIAAMLPIAAAPSAGCYTHQCDSNPSDFCGGHMLDENTFETNGVDEVWINYPGQVVLTVHYPMDMGRPMAWYQAYVGISRQPNRADANFTEAVGSLAEMHLSNSTGFTVSNTTCASYYARFVVHFPPLPIDGGSAPRDSGSGDGRCPTTVHDGSNAD